MYDEIFCDVYALVRNTAKVTISRIHNTDFLTDGVIML